MCVGFKSPLITKSDGVIGSVQIGARPSLGSNGSWQVSHARVSHIVNDIAEHKSPSFKAYCGYQLGIAYDMLGEKEKATKAFMPVPGWVRKVIFYRCKFHGRF